MTNRIEPSKTIIHFIRHGEVYNPNNILYARIPRYHLSKKGIQEARSVAAYLKTHSIAAVFHSPMLRAKQTARIIAAEHGLVMKPTALLNEIYTPYEGKPHTFLESIKWDLYSNIDSEYEQPEDIMRRIKHFSQRVLREYLGREVVAVTHGDIVLHAQMWARRLDPTYENLRGVPEYPATGSINTLTFTGANPQPTFSYQVPFKG